MTSLGIRLFHKNEFFLVLLLVFSFLYLAFLLLPTIIAGDSGELVTAAWYLGIPHPSGYPLYMLTSKAATLLPFGNIASRANLLSLLIIALMLSLLFPITRMLTSLTGKGNEVNLGTILISSCIAALFFSCTPSFLNYLPGSEVYALNALIFFLILFGSLKSYTSSLSLKNLCLTMFLLGLAIGNHHTIILSLPLAALFLPALKKINSSPYVFRNYSIMLAFFILGLSIYLYLPVRSMSNPLLNWGAPNSVSFFSDVFFRSGYGGDSVARPLATFLKQLGSFNLLEEFGYTGLSLGILGFVALWKGCRYVSFCLLLTFAFFSVFIIVLAGDFRGDYRILKPFFVPSVLIFTLFISLGISCVISRFKSSCSGRAALIVFIFLLLLVLCLGAARRLKEGYGTDDFLAFDYGMNTLKSIDSGSTYLAYVDSKLFALWYLQMVERYRDDVELVPVDFLGQAWYSKGKSVRERLFFEPDSPTNKFFYTSSLDEAKLFSKKTFSKGITFRQGIHKEESDLDVWKYYTLRGIDGSGAFKTYEYGNILENYASAYFNLGLDYYMQGKLIDASKAYEKSFQIRPDEADVLNNLALTYADMGVNLHKAEAMAKAAEGKYIERDKKVIARDTLGWVYYRLGRYSDALEILESCREYISEDPFYLYHLGLTLAAMNRIPEAKVHLEEAIPSLFAAARKEALIVLESASAISP